MKKMNKFVLSTLVAAAAMTSTAWAEGTTVTVESAGEIKNAISTVNNAFGGTINLGSVKYVYSAPLIADANMATITNVGTYTFTGGKGALINYEIEVNPGKLEGDYVVDLDDAHITMTKLTLRENATLSLTNSRLDYNGHQGGSAYLSVYSNSKLLLTDSILGYDPHKTCVEDPQNYTHTGSNKDFFGPRIAIYGSAEITRSTIYTGPGQTTHEGFNVLGNASATMTDSTLHTNLISVGGCGLEENRLASGTDTSNLSASLTLNNVKVDNIQYRGDSTSYSGIMVGTESTSGTLNITSGSEIDMTVLKHTDSREQGLTIGAKGTVNISYSSVTVMKVVNAGTLTVSGDSTFKADEIVVAKGITFGVLGDGIRDKVALGSVTSDKTMNFVSTSEKKSGSLRFNDSDVTLCSSLNIDLEDSSVPNKFLYFNQSTLNLNGNDLYVDGKFIANGLSIKGKGTITIENGDQPCWQNYAGSIGEGVVFKAPQVTVYEDLTVEGVLNCESASGLLIGSHAVDKDSSGKIEDWYSNGAILKVSGKDAVVDVKKGGITIYGANDELNEQIKTDLGEDIGLESSKLIVENEATVTVEKGITNNGVIEVGEGSVLTATAITGTGDVIIAGTVNVGSLTADELTIVVGDAGAIETSAAVMLLAESGEASVSVDKLTVVADNAEGLDLSTILTSKVGADMAGVIESSIAADESSSVEFVLQNSNGLKYETTVNSDGSITVGALTPEPSAFGLLAGLGAIALAVSRRRRNCR